MKGLEDERMIVMRSRIVYGLFDGNLGSSVNFLREKLI